MATTVTGPRVPRDPVNDYTPAAASARREFLREQTGVELKHVGQYSFDTAMVSGNVENFAGVAQVPIGIAGPLRINGEHAKGRLLCAHGHHRGNAGGQLQPRHAVAVRVWRCEGDRGRGLYAAGPGVRPR